MTEPSIDVDRVVREVLARLGGAPQSDGAGAGEGGAGGSAGESRSSSEAPQAPAKAAAERNGELAVSAQVVTMRELDGRLGGVRRLVVQPEAVVTPSVRDELKRKGIALERDHGPSVPCAGTVRLVTMVLGSRFDPEPLARALQSEAVQVETHRSDCLIAATDQLAGEVRKPDTLGLVVTGYRGAALCLANRHQGVRAVLGADAGTVGADAASVGANALVVDPGSASLFQMKLMVSRFCREGPRACPEVFRERLE